jgi:RimJ/RimL family protein N-acetyltransferase
MSILGRELLEGEKVRLTALQRSDAGAITRWQLDMEYQRLLRRGMVFPTNQENIEGWLFSSRGEEGFFPFAIRTLADDRLIGMLAIKDVMWSSRNASFFISIGDAADRGRGFGTDAVRVMLKYCFMEMNLYRVGLETMAYNPMGISAYRRAGFQEEGRLRGFVYRDGTYYDMVLMSILRPEWDALTDR